MAKINGEEVTNAAGKTIMEYLTEAGYDSRRVAIERNGSIIPKKSYEEVIITEADTIEIVSFVGGG
ncbi:MAG: sulfur carrier protein ThiS [Lachnospiraceae bacterium]|nr:sulfur carrier protein ThiS [Lachnospiraceae bacterium]